MPGFDCKESTLPTVIAALLDTSIVLLGQLHMERGDGPWADELQEHLARLIKNRDFSDISMDAEKENVEAGLAAVQAIFATIPSEQ